MKLHSKFHRVQFPAFGLARAPYQVKIRLNSIYITKQEGEEPSAVDNFFENASLIARYMAVKDDSFTFDFTCLTLTQLISKPIPWVIDSNAIMHDLSKKETFKARNVPIVHVKGSLFWVRSVTSPFKLPTTILDPQELLRQHVTIVYVDGSWTILKFTSFSEPISEITL